MQGGTGHACTCVAVEFRYHELSSFNISVELVPEEELLSRLSELIRAYQLFHLHRQDIEGGDDSQAEKQANLAQDTLSSMFPGDARFSRHSLLNSSIDVMEERMREKVSQIRPYGRSLNRVGLTAAACAEQLADFSSVRQSTEGLPEGEVMWPFIQKIRRVLRKPQNGLLS